MTNGRTYTEDDRVEVLARLQQGQSQREVSRETGVPLSTVNEWHVISSEAAAASFSVAGVVPDGTSKTEHANRWSRAQKLATERIAAAIEALPDTLKPSEIRELAIVAGISADKHLDYTEGRKGAQIVNDNRQLTVQLTPEQARAMLADAQRQALPAPDNSSSE